MKTRYTRRAGLLGVLTMALVALATIPANVSAGDWPSDGPVGYSLNTVGTGTATFSAGEVHSDPYSIKMTTDAYNDKSEIIFPGSVQLEDVYALSYWTYTESTYFGNVLGGIVRVYPAIYLHEDDGKSLEDWYSDLSGGSDKVYYIQAEPFYIDPYGISLDTWEKFDAFDADDPLLWTGMESPDLPFWAPTLEDYIDGSAVSYPTPYWGDQSFASREYGSLYVVAIKLRAGYGGTWTDFIAYTDDVTINDYFEEFGPLPMTIDFKPGLDDKKINLKSNGEVQVAILATDDFDPADVDPDTITFAGASPTKWSRENVNNDKVKDLKLHFDIQDLELTTSSTTATMAGFTYGGVPVEGSVSIQVKA